MLAGAGNLLNRSPDPRLAAGLVSVEFGEGVAKLVLALAPPADAHTRDYAAGNVLPISRVEAMRRAARQEPEAFRRYQAA